MNRKVFNEGLEWNTEEWKIKNLPSTTVARSKQARASKQSLLLDPITAEFASAYCHRLTHRRVVYNTSNRCCCNLTWSQPTRCVCMPLLVCYAHSGVLLWSPFCGGSLLLPLIRRIHPRIMVRFEVANWSDAHRYVFTAWKQVMSSEN